jgi:L-ascorbate metabolism protein UlaG (beta-lactamase superfamily)
MFKRQNRYYTGPISSHFDGVRFFNPGGEAPRGFKDLLRWQFDGERAAWPQEVTHIPARPAPTVDDLTITMIGHATLLIQTAGLNLLTDPVFSDRASPLSRIGPKRVAAPGVRFEALPRIDAVLLSHNHYDHLDLASLRALHRRDAPLILTPLGNDKIIHRHIPAAKISTADWGENRRVGPLTVHFEPCHHWSARGMGDRSMALWAAFVIEGPRGTVLHIGDTGFDAGRPYRDLAARFGPLRAAILPIGAYEPRWFMRAQHQNPAEAVEGFVLSGAAHAIGHHWGTFQLTNEPRHAPLEALASALEAQDIPQTRFRPLAPGEAWAIPPL